ncbi:MAG: YceI family protein [Caulobacteraceae bacterium]
MNDRIRQLAAACALAALAACSPAPKDSVKASEPAAAPAPPSPAKVDLPAGAYTLDKAHADLTFKLSHLGFSNYTARFADFDVKLQFEPANPSAMKVEATIDPRSLTLPHPPAGFTKELLGPQWLDVAKFPAITFRSTGVELTGPKTAKVTGDFTLHGVTKPVVLDATFHGGYAGHPMDPHARIGFSATGKLKRGDFGVASGIPAPGSTMGVGDEIDVIIEAELSGPPLATAAKPAA